MAVWTLLLGVSLAYGRILQAEITEKVYLDIGIDEEPVGRIVIGLFGHLLPRAALNFKTLCKGDSGRKTAEGLPLHYKGTAFTKVVEDYMVQGGDVSRGGKSGGESAFGMFVPDEDFRLGHVAAGLVSMVNKGSHTNASQFMITLGAASWLDEKQVVIGEVVEGMEVLELMEAEASPSGVPLHRIEVLDSGTA